MSALEAISLPAHRVGPVPNWHLDQEPLNVTSPDEELPSVEWLVITWTKDEHKALRRAFTPTVKIDDWFKYTHNFEVLFQTFVQVLLQDGFSVLEVTIK